jgi:twitching motility protein PilT
MYSLDDLLCLASTKNVDGFKLRVGKQPVIIVDGCEHKIEGPDITIEQAEQFLLNIADTRQRRIFRERGQLQFFYMYKNSTRFLVLVKLTRENIEFDIY